MPDVRLDILRWSWLVLGISGRTAQKDHSEKEETVDGGVGSIEAFVDVSRSSDLIYAMSEQRFCSGEGGGAVCLEGLEIVL